MLRIKEPVSVVPVVDEAGNPVWEKGNIVTLEIENADSGDIVENAILAVGGTPEQAEQYARNVLAQDLKNQNPRALADFQTPAEIAQAEAVRLAAEQAALEQPITGGIATDPIIGV